MKMLSILDIFPPIFRQNQIDSKGKGPHISRKQKQPSLLAQQEGTRVCLHSEHCVTSQVCGQQRWPHLFCRSATHDPVSPTLVYLQADPDVKQIHVFFIVSVLFKKENKNTRVSSTFPCSEAKQGTGNLPENIVQRVRAWQQMMTALQGWEHLECGDEVCLSWS